jgi:hypothetical protein
MAEPAHVDGLAMSPLSEYASIGPSCAQPSTGLPPQRDILQRAVRHVHSVDQDTVSAAHALSLFADPIAQFLQDQGNAGGRSCRIS